ncbi:uncharacterized protein LOC113234330 [Hyposmocoma kahamanoa]|uniref:uncharacterized protein LOC113234330 n=1 Tax=Hyposmocoma kahamanoa TaxID=1477025 RepID=UPI000E6D9024|nr:uncharacterized protein LOC113234330 [Hyposmocoma kahamanoa]
MFFTLCLRHSYLPEPLMRTVVVPITKNKTGDVSDTANYRPISLATIMAKCYTNRKTPVYACFLDLSKAFDLVNYEILWSKLRDTSVPRECIELFRFWYQNQVNQVRWADAMSEEYRLECGVRQGGLSSPTLFNLYIDRLIEELSGMHVGCHVDGTCVNNISYADDMVLLGPSIGSIVKLVATCERYAAAHGLKYNSKKSEVLIFKSSKFNPVNVPSVVLAGTALRVVDRFKYLGHMLTDELKDDLDVERERRALAVRSNVLTRRFARCSFNVKLTLFKAYCTSFYSSSLWCQYTKRAYNNLRVQYNNAFRMLMRLPRHCSASGMFAEARSDGFHAIMRKKAASFLHRARGSRNSILNTLVHRFDSPILIHLIRRVIGQIK